MSRGYRLNPCDARCSWRGYMSRNLQDTDQPPATQGVRGEGTGHRLTPTKIVRRLDYQSIERSNSTINDGIDERSLVWANPPYPHTAFHTRRANKQ